MRGDGGGGDRGGERISPISARSSRETPGGTEGSRQGLPGRSEGPPQSSSASTRTSLHRHQPATPRPPAAPSTSTSPQQSSSTSSATAETFLPPGSALPSSPCRAKLRPPPSSPAETPSGDVQRGQTAGDVQRILRLRLWLQSS